MGIIGILFCVLGATGTILALYKFVSDKRRDNILADAEKNSMALQFASDKLKGDKDYVLAAVIRNGLALQYASEELKDDRDIVLAAVKENGCALQFASDELKGDKDIIVLAAATQDKGQR